MEENNIHSRERGLNNNFSMFEPADVRIRFRVTWNWK